MAIPAKMNKGTAISTCLVSAPNETWISVDKGKFNPQIAAIELPVPKTKKIGTEMQSKISENIKAKTYINL
jgi:hypothetical protein